MFLDSKLDFKEHVQNALGKNRVATQTPNNFTKTSFNDDLLIIFRKSSSKL